MFLLRLLFVFFLPGLLSAGSLPSVIKKCKNDHTLNDCILQQANEVTKVLSKGDPKHGVPVVDPLFIPKIERTQSGTNTISLNLTMENVNIYGFANSEIVKTELDTQNKFLRLIFKIPILKLIADYKLNGKFLVIRLTGNGKVVAKMDNVTVNSTVTYKLEQKKGEDYAIFNPNPNLYYTTTKANFHLENLFNGDKALGDATNNMINENWEEFNKELGPGVAQGIAQVYGHVIAKIASSVPYKHLFLQS